MKKNIKIQNQKLEGFWIVDNNINTLIFKIIFIGDSETDHYAASAIRDPFHLKGK